MKKQALGNTRFVDLIRKKNVDDIIKRSHKATCGITEREVYIKAQELYPTVAKLERAGFNVIGTSFGKTPIKTVWFIRRGGI